MIQSLMSRFFQTVADCSPLRRGAAFLDDVDHRPWPLPSGAWLMAQTWQDLLFAHWPIEPSAVQSLLPYPPLQQPLAGDKAPYHTLNGGRCSIVFKYPANDLLLYRFSKN